MSEQNFSALVSSIQDQISKILQTVERLVVKQDYTDQAICELKTSVNEIKDKPAKRWELAVGTIITGVIGIFVGFIASYFVH